jgi:hypothetical protein
MNYRIGMKHYGFDWFDRFSNTYAEEAGMLHAHAIDFVVIQNLIDPVATTAAASYDQLLSKRLGAAGYDDRAFRDALRSEGIAYYENLAVFFNPGQLVKRPELTAVDADGRRMRKIDWYVGLCPTDKAYLADRAAIAEEIVASMNSEGLYLDWIRFPGFWELWMPETKRDSLPEYCFCERCVARFQEEAHVAVPNRSREEQIRLILKDFRKEWSAWKCSVIADAVGEIKRAAQRQRPDIKILTNGVAFGIDDYDNAVEEILGQNIEVLAQHTDSFTFMFYHQISRRDPSAWIAQKTAEVEARTTRPFYATLQTKPAYLEPMHEAGRRRSSIPFKEHVVGLQAIADSPADGVMVYQWTDYLEAEASGDFRPRNALHAFKEGRLQSLPEAQFPE